MEHYRKDHADLGDKEGKDLESDNAINGQHRGKRQDELEVLEVRARDIDILNDVRCTSDQNRYRQRAKPKRTNTYPERMTQDQDKAFEDWTKSCEKVDSNSKKNIEEKYHSLCRCLFGEAIELPSTPCQ